MTGPPFDPLQSIVKDLVKMEDRMARMERALRSGGGPIAVQRLEGNSEAYATAVTNLSPATNLPLYRDAAKTVPLAVTFKPPIDAWWEVTLNVGLLDKFTEGLDQFRWSVAFGLLTPAPASGTAFSYNIRAHSNLTRQQGHFWQKTFPLLANVQYTCSAVLSTSGGNFSYWQGINHLWIEGRAYPRT